MLTDDMTRLCGEIVALRNKRGELMADLVSSTEAMKRSVADCCTHFTDMRAQMARSTGADRARFMSSLKRSVGAQCQAMQADLAGARKAWAGKGK